MSKRFDITAVTGKYKDAHGTEKNRYQTIGVVIEGKNGMMIKMESIPVGWDGWAYLNEPKLRESQPPQRQGRQAPASRPASGFDDMDDDIPF